MVRHARIELASQPWQGRVFNQHTHAAKKWRIAKVPPPMPALAGHHPISSRRPGLPELTIHKMEERKGLAPLTPLSKCCNLSKIAPRLAGLSPCVSFSIPADTTGLFLLVSVLKTTQRVISNLKWCPLVVTHHSPTSHLIKGNGFTVHR